jgi:vitamin B12 transporter
MRNTHWEIFDLCPGQRCFSALIGGLVTTMTIIDAAQAEPEPEARMLPETVVSANRVAVPSREVGSSVTVITGEEMQERQIRVVADALRDVPGVSVSRTGPRGGFTQVRIRGNEGNHTKVFIDGVEVNDPSGDVEFDFAHLLAADIERVEIIRGPQSALWGSDAIGGVINVITKRGKSGTRASGYLEAGSFDTYSGNAALRGAGKNYRYALSGSFLKTQGVNMSRFGSGKDGYKNGTLNVSGAVDPTETLELSVNGMYIKNNVQSDPQDFASGLFFDGDQERDGDQFYGRAQGKLKVFGGQWEHIFGGNYTDTSFKNTFDQDFSSANTGTKSRLDYQTNVFFSTPESAMDHTVTLYAEYTHETFTNEVAEFAEANQKQSNDATSVAGEYLLALDRRYFLTGSLRYDNNDLFKNSTTYRITLAYQPPETGTRVHSSFGTGVKNPGFFDLFGFVPGPDSFDGNENLNPESSIGGDIGIEQKFFQERLVMDFTYFRSVLTDEIVTVFLPGGPPFMTTVANQTGESTRQGLEISAAAAITKSLNLTAAYTYTDAKDPDGRDEVRRPKNIASLALNYLLPSRRGNVNLNIQYNGPMEDSEFGFLTPNDRVDLPSFTLVTLAGAYNFNKSVQFFGRIENLLNQDYEEVWSAQSPGIGVFAGVRLRTDLN